MLSRKDTVELVEFLIHVSNSIPLDYYFPEPPRNYREFTQEEQERFYQSYVEQVRASLPKQGFMGFLNHVVLEEMSPQSVFEHCAISNNLRELLWAIARANETEPFYSESQQIRSIGYQPLNLYTIDGVLSALDPWRPLIGRDVSRVRTCAVCHRLYWQHRRGVAYCRSEKCGNKFNVDKFRGKSYTDKYKINRIRADTDREVGNSRPLTKPERHRNLKRGKT